ncbi:Photosystem I assembly protein Ycf3 [uncultured archaeon]|nr:Photosystem I assembly protein Ycf3 [uncultured archaeon]
MTDINSIHVIREQLIRLGYNEAKIDDIMGCLDNLFNGIEFDKIKQAAGIASGSNDTEKLIGLLKNLMKLLEDRGYYRPDAPTELIRLLVNGLNLRNEDIFAVLDRANIPEIEKDKEKELLASCAAITQLGYILTGSLVPEVKSASAGVHVFLIINGISPDSMIFVDFSIDSIIEVDRRQYLQKENYYYLKNPGTDDETSKLLTEYYSFFQATAGTGLSHNIHNNLGIAYDKIGRYDEAIEELQCALDLDPGYIEAHNNLAIAYEHTGRTEEAIAELGHALRLNPQYVEAHSNLGNIYAGQGRFEGGIEELKEALRIKPGYAPAHNALGTIFTEQGKEQEAIEEFREAIRIDPGYAPAHNNLGNAYAGQGKYDEALREFEEALRLVPEFPEAYHGIGSVYYNLGSYDRASRAFMKAVYLAPGLLDSVPPKLSLKVRQGISRMKNE